MNNNVTVRAPQAASLAYTFTEVQRMAACFAKSGLFGVKDPDSAFALMLYAQAMGKAPALIMRDYELIGNRLAKKADAMYRDFQASGGRVKWIRYSDEGVTGIFSHPFCPDPVTVDWDHARAERAGLAGKSGGMYDKYTRAMYRARCITEGVRTCAPECTEQLYGPEELEGIEAPEPVQIGQAVTEAVEHVKGMMSIVEIDALSQTLNLETMPELTKAFAAAYRATKGDERARQLITDKYNAMKQKLQSSAIAIDEESPDDAA